MGETSPDSGQPSATLVDLSVDQAIATITIDRPEKRNALTPHMRVELEHAFRQAQDDPAVGAIILRGRGDHFCAGADIAFVGQGGVAGAIAAVKRAHRMIASLAGIEKPVIAAVEGFCIGVGWSLALACDFVIAAEEARFVFGFRNLGLAPDAGATYLLARHIGLMHAKHILFTGNPVSGDEAARLGLALEAVAPGTTYDRALDLARQYADGPGLALAMCKRQFAAASSQTLDDALALEAAMVPLMMQTEDFAEGVAAFTQRRPAAFRSL